MHMHSSASQLGWSMPSTGCIELAYNCGMMSRLTDHILPLPLCSIPLMSTDLCPPITCDLMTLQAHAHTQPDLAPGNLFAIIQWNAIGELYLISQLAMHCCSLMLNFDFAGKCRMVG